MPPRPSHLRITLPLVLALVAACRSTPEVDPRYRPAENVLEVIAVLRHHVPDDTYRFPPARDFTGRNVYRSSLLRLESIERVHADALRAGHMGGVIAFAKGRALERMSAYDLAEEAYLLAAESDPVLKAEALRSADVCAALDEAIHIGPPIDEIEGGDATLRVSNANPEAVLANFEERVAKLEELSEVVAGTHHYYIVEEEIERADIARAGYFAGLRKVLTDGDVRAVAESQRVVVLHSDSKNLNRRLLALADLYADLAVEYADGNPPEGLTFDPARFQELIDAGTRLYEMVAHQDGTPEKLEASRRLEAFLAFALAIDNDRFTP
jgi:tetratricopeptide (TPR) repeat protein